MDHLLNLSKAAKLAGVSRRTIQARIQDGDLEAFEGHVRMSALLALYPDVDLQADAVVERMGRIRENALHKIEPDEISDQQVLAAQVHRLQVELADTVATLDAYQLLVMELKSRLERMKAGCTRKEKQSLQALIGWITMQVKPYS